MLAGKAGRAEASAVEETVVVALVVVLVAAEFPVMHRQRELLLARLRMRPILLLRQLPLRVDRAVKETAVETVEATTTVEAPTTVVAVAVVAGAVCRFGSTPRLASTIWP
jgi:hypothetical protein